MSLNKEPIIFMMAKDFTDTPGGRYKKTRIWISRGNA